MADQETKEFDTNVADADERKRIRAQDRRATLEKGALDKANESARQLNEVMKAADRRILISLDKKKSAGIESHGREAAADWGSSTKWLKKKAPRSLTTVTRRSCEFGQAERHYRS